jgi:hypothetical protein
MDLSFLQQIGISIGRIGFTLSVIGLTGVAFVGWTWPIVSEAGSYLAFASLPGLASSVIGHVVRPTSGTRWGMAIGFVASFYLATIWFGLTHF